MDSLTTCRVLVIGLLGALHSALGAPPQVTESQLKAVYLLNFSHFVEWPESSAGSRLPFALCVVGEDPFGPTLDQTVEGETVNGRKIVVRRIQREAPAGCGILYVSAQEKNVSDLLGTAGPGVLTVGEGDAFLDRGGMIAFVVENRHVRFDADPASARKAGLRLSSRLLNVARIVR